MTSRLELRGEVIFLVPEGRPASTWVSGNGYRWLSIPRGARGNGRRLKHARVKFRLAHGYWPLEVDHRDRDRTNDLLSNLVEEDRLGNMANRTPPSRELPTGVYKPKRGDGFVAAVKRHRVRHHLGYFPTVEAAAAAVTAFKLNPPP